MIAGRRIGKWYVALKSPDERAYFSERNRIGCTIIGKSEGWRIVARKAPKVPA